MDPASSTEHLQSFAVSASYVMKVAVSYLVALVASDREFGRYDVESIM